MQRRQSAWITPREAEILDLVAKGLADKEIARRLGVAVRTVGTHLERLFTRLNVHSRAQALAWCYAQHDEVRQVQEELDRLVQTTDTTEPFGLSRELALVKLAVNGSRRDLAIAEVDRFGGRLVDAAPGQVIVEVSGDLERVDRFLEAMRRYKICGVARSGPVAMSKEEAHELEDDVVSVEGRESISAGNTFQH